jgi:hypothetical protein
MAATGEPGEPGEPVGEEVEGVGFSDLNGGELLEVWDTNMFSGRQLTFEERDLLLAEITKKGFFPRLYETSDALEKAAGLYPATEDPRFIQKLMMKAEFAEAKQDSIADQAKAGVNPCEATEEYELTPVQRFVSRFLSPQCPYQSALLYHGVGVGKTCAAITIAEKYLEMYPYKKVFIVAPRNIQPGFYRTIFDADGLKIPKEEGALNTAKGCTGNTYLKLTDMEREKDSRVILRAVERAIKARYNVMGYYQFSNYIKRIISVADKQVGDAKKERIAQLLRREFTGKLVIIDEAHNLRDNPSQSSEDEVDVPDAGEGEEIDDEEGGISAAEADAGLKKKGGMMTNAKAGKALTSVLEDVLDSSDGMKLVLLTATPMYNNYKEIIFLLNLLLRNDKKATISESDIFGPDGSFVAENPSKGKLIGGRERLGAIASAYVSFMRGENPLSFPVRLPPEGNGIKKLKEWPTNPPRGDKIIEDAIRAKMLSMPFVPVSYEEDSLEKYQQLMVDIGSEEGSSLSINEIDMMIQSGNWIFPDDGTFDTVFKNIMTNKKGRPQYEIEENYDQRFLLRENLARTSPKAKLILDRIQSAEGPVFIFSRFINGGVVPLALALEANGYTPYGRRPLLLNGGAKDGLGRQCALCEKREVGHPKSGHIFTPATYVLLTGSDSISNDNEGDIKAARGAKNTNGEIVKVVLGSQVASEGVDLRFIREIYLFDSWYHLNRMEQVLGRGIRTCSHAALPSEKRNCTIHLLINTIIDEENEDGVYGTVETADMYMYRMAMEKAIQTGRVTRVLKEYALDCNLNRDAIIVSGLGTQRHVDSQGEERPEVNINDTPFTNLCDWLETCDYKCAIDVSGEVLDYSTYDEYAGRWRDAEIKKIIRRMFEEAKQPVFQIENIIQAMSSVPEMAVHSVMASIVGNKGFKLKIGRVNGYIIYKNGYYLFQPDYLSDYRIPLALRVADMPVKKDFFEPMEMKVPKLVVATAAAAAAAAAAPAVKKEGVVAAPVAAAPVAAAPAALRSFWSASKAEAEAIARGSAASADFSDAFKAALKEKYPGELYDEVYERISIINWLYEDIYTSPIYKTDEDKTRDLTALSKTFLEFMWDEMLRPDEQEILLDDDTAKDVAREQIIVIPETKSESIHSFRYVDVSTVNEIIYKCDGKVCISTIKTLLEDKDPLKNLKIDATTTGALYGFIVPRVDLEKLVFKTSDGSSKNGAECALVDTREIHVKKLISIGDILEKGGHSRFMLTSEAIKAASGAAKSKAYNRKLKNVPRLCALMNIILRFIDILRIGDKRYFYRPIASIKGGHKGKKKEENKGTGKAGKGTSTGKAGKGGV